jgi:long-subunit acyl-CoA synthetase (AMP-forming)
MSETISGVMQALRQCAALYDGATAISDATTSLTRAGLAGRVAGFAGDLLPLPQTLGLLGENGVDWTIAQLAGWLAGKTVVPLPTFFSEAQLGHIIADTGITHVIATAGARELAMKLAVTPVGVSLARREMFPQPAPGGGQIIYTSGSTGRPKGVRLSLAQIDCSAARLAEATDAAKTDKYLSVLPLPLLLETICAICVPILAGARTHFDTQLSASVARGCTDGIAAAFDRHQPTTSVLVPQVLSAWVAQLLAANARAPGSLRFVAVGGAPVGAELAEKAWTLGIPAHEGYGLSECCSVVAVNRPGQRQAGTVGQVLPGLTVSIDEGEILVDGPTVMEGYLHGGPAAHPWRTGDLGALDSAGYLTVYGRKDNLIVTSYGRNVSPEWIEAMLLADPRFAACAVLGHGAPHLSAIIIPSQRGARWLAEAPKSQVLMTMALACRDAPAYAVPRDFVAMSPEDALRRDLLTSNGRFRRAGLAAAYAELKAKTASPRHVPPLEKEKSA